MDGYVSDCLYSANSSYKHYFKQGCFVKLNLRLVLIYWSKQAPFLPGKDLYSKHFLGGFTTEMPFRFYRENLDFVSHIALF